MNTLCLSQIEQQLRTKVVELEPGWNLSIALRIHSEANQREHWATKAKRVKMKRGVVGHALWFRELILKRPRPELPVTVIFTRLAARRLDDDNLCGGFKACRDEVASWLGVNDNDPRVTWRYAQERGKGFACRIEITPS